MSRYNDDSNNEWRRRLVMVVESHKDLTEKFPHHNILIMDGVGKEDGTGMCWGVSYSGGGNIWGAGNGTGNHCSSDKLYLNLTKLGIENNTYDDRIL